MNAVRSLIARLPIDPYLLMLLATVGLALALPPRGEMRGVVDLVVFASVGLLFFLYGARLSPAAIWAGATHWRLQLLVFASTFVLFPIIGFAIGAVVKSSLPIEITTGLVFVSLLPSTVQSSIAFTSIARGNVPAALCSASISNMLGVVLTPLLVSVAFPTPGGLSGGTLRDIALQILLPFVAGQFARPKIGAWLLRHRTLTSVVDRGSVLIIVYAAFGAGMAEGVFQLVSAANLGIVLVLDMLMLALVIGVTTFASRFLGFSTEDEIAIVFCGSKKSMAAGLPMANILFPANTVGLIVLPLMIFHQGQLFVCAVLARRYAARKSASIAADSLPTAKPINGAA
jgi:sodium/bile acid cotransporter 7